MYALAWMCSADAAYLYTYLHFALHLQCNYQGLGCVSPSFNALIFLARPYYRPTSELLTLIFIELVGQNAVRRSTGSLILSRRYITSLSFRLGFHFLTPPLTMIAQVSSALRAATAAVKLSRVAPAVLEVDGVGSLCSFQNERFHQAVTNEKSLQWEKTI